MAGHFSGPCPCRELLEIRSQRARFATENRAQRQRVSAQPGTIVMIEHRPKPRHALADRVWIDSTRIELATKDIADERCNCVPVEQTVGAELERAVK